MLRRLALMFSLRLALVPVALAGEKKDEDAIQGTWVAAEAELGGKKLSTAQPIKLVIKDGKYDVTIDHGTVKIDASAKPKSMDITGTDGPNKGKTFMAIYELDSDTMRICYDLSGK